MDMKNVIKEIEKMDTSDFDEALLNADNQQQRDLLANLWEYSISVRQAKIIKEEKFTI